MAGNQFWNSTSQHTAIIRFKTCIAGDFGELVLKSLGTSANMCTQGESSTSVVDHTLVLC